MQVTYFDLVIEVRVLSFKMDWSKARDWCAQKRMRLASLKTLNQMKAVSNELNRRNIGKISHKNRKYASNFWL
jgi:hypothetical protein